MRLLPVLLALCAFAPARAVAADLPDYETFDASALPDGFKTQQARDAIARHKPGDRYDAMMIQRRLAAIYKASGDAARAAQAEQRALEAKPEKPALRTAKAKRVAAASPAARAAHPGQAAATPSEFSGRFYGTDAQGTLHTWDFNPDGTFYHTRIVRGARSGERGTFKLSGDRLTFQIGGTATGFVAQGLGGRSAVLGGGAGSGGEVRRVTLRRLGPEIELDGQRLKVKNW